MVKIALDVIGCIAAVILLVYLIRNRREVAKSLVTVISSKVRLFLIGILVLLCSFAFKSGHDYVNDRLTDVYNNGDGTMTLVTTNIRIPVETYGKVVSVRKDFKYLAGIPDRGGIYIIRYHVTCLLDDGRTVDEMLNEKHDGLKKGKEMKFIEKFYPDYESEIVYLGDK